MPELVNEDHEAEDENRARIASIQTVPERGDARPHPRRRSCRDVSPGTIGERIQCARNRHADIAEVNASVEKEGHRRFVRGVEHRRRCAPCAASRNAKRERRETFGRHRLERQRR